MIYADMMDIFRPLSKKKVPQNEFDRSCRSACTLNSLLIICMSERKHFLRTILKFSEIEILGTLFSSGC